MDTFDPHIHVDADLHTVARTRSMLAGTFGLAADLPSHTTTGCERRVPYAMTSTDPAKVTCLPCRDFAHRRYLELADHVRGMRATPGLSAEMRAQVEAATEQYRELARRFGASGG